MPNGNYDEELFNSGALDKFLLFNKALSDPWETIYFHDRKVKHEARAYVGVEGRVASRDVIVNFMRKPLRNKVDVMLRKESLIGI